jgi:hypothetical protein
MRGLLLFNGVTESNDPIGYSEYNALQFRFERKIKTLDFVVNYYYSNWMDTNSYLNSGNFVDATLWHGLDGNDRRHFFNDDMVWPLPIGQGGKVLRNAHGWLGQVVNHWVVDSVPQWASGFPLPIINANLVGGAGCTSYYPAGGQTRAHWFNNNTSCYQPLNTWQARTTPLNVGYLRDPGGWTWNSAALKKFTLPREGRSVTLRMDCSVCTNTPLFGAPNTTLSAVPTLNARLGWTGFGTLPSSQSNSTRAILISLTISF